jgi:hypothetical protein
MPRVDAAGYPNRMESPGRRVRFTWTALGVLSVAMAGCGGGDTVEVQSGSARLNRMKGPAKGEEKKAEPPVSEKAK